MDMLRDALGKGKTTEESAEPTKGEPAANWAVLVVDPITVKVR